MSIAEWSCNRLKGLPTEQMPQAGQIAGGTLGYYMHAGGHGSIPSDWEVFLRFMEERFER